MNKETIEQVASRCGLKPATVRDMLDNGWTYIEEFNVPLRWVFN